MPIPVTVKPVYDRTNNILTNYISWETSSLTSDLTTTLYRSIGTSSIFGNFEIVVANLNFKTNRFADRGVYAGKQYYYLLYPSNEEFPEAVESLSSVSATPILSEVPEPVEQIFDPIKPLNFSVSQNNSRQIVFNWEFEKENKNPIVIEYSINNNYEFFTLVSQIPSWRTSITIDDPNSTDIYYYRAYTVNKNKERSEYSDIVSLLSYAFSKAAPQTPTNLQVIGVGQSTLTLTWTNNNPLEAGLEHLIYISTPGAPLSLLDSVLYDSNNPNSASSFTVTGLNRSTIYCFVCQARNLGGTSNYSQPAEGYTVEQETAPNSPTGLSGANIFDISPNIGLIKAQRIYWNNPTINNATERYLQYSTSSNFSNASSISLLINDTATILVDLTNDTTYYYRLSSVNSVSSVLSTSAQIYMPNPPALPTGLTANSVGEETIRLNWTDNSNDEALFLLQISGGTYPTYQEVVAIPSDTNTFFLNNNVPQINLQSNTAYNFLLYSIGYGGFSGTPATWTSATATTQGAVPAVPAAPINLRASGQTDIGTFAVQFDDRSTDEDFFELFLASKTYRDLREIPGVAGSGNVVTYEITGLVPDVEYLVNVRAKNKTGYSNYANVSGGTSIDLSISTTPFVFLNSSLAIEASGISGTYKNPFTTGREQETIFNSPLVVLNWSDPFAYGDGFKVWQVLNGSEQLIELADLTPNVSSYVHFIDDVSENYTNKYIVKKYLRTYGEKVYSSGIEETVTIGSLSNAPYFTSNQFEVNLNSVRTGRSTVDLFWDTFANANILEIVKYVYETNTSSVLLSGNAESFGNNYTDTSAYDYQTIQYSLNIKNSVLNSSATRLQTVPRYSFDGISFGATLPLGEVPPSTELPSVTYLNASQNGSSSINIVWVQNPDLVLSQFYPRSIDVLILDESFATVYNSRFDASLTSVQVTGLQTSETYHIFVTYVNVLNEEAKTVSTVVRLRPGYAGELDPVKPAYATLQGISILSVVKEGRSEVFQGVPFQKYKITWQVNPITRSFNINTEAIGLFVEALDYNPPVSVFQYFAPTQTTYTTNFLNPGNYRFTLYGASSLPLTTESISLPSIFPFSVNFSELIPQPVTNFRFITTSRNRVVLTWTRPENSAYYRIKKTVTINPTTVSYITITDPDATSYEDTDLIVGSTVTYEIASYLTGYESAYSVPITFEIPSDPEPPIPPSVVDAPRVCPTGSNLKAGNVYYRVRRT